jgi:hypothetical protein
MERPLTCQSTHSPMRQHHYMNPLFFLPDKIQVRSTIQITPFPRYVFADTRRISKPANATQFEKSHTPRLSLSGSHLEPLPSVPSVLLAEASLRSGPSQRHLTALRWTSLVKHVSIYHQEEEAVEWWAYKIRSAFGGIWPWKPLKDVSLRYLRHRRRSSRPYLSP